MTIFAASRSRVRAGALGLALASSAALLTACDKPLTKITVLSGSKSVIVSPFTGVAGDLCKAGATSIGDVSAAGGGTILVDVPKKVADEGWFVSSFVVDASCQLQSVPSATTDPVREHTVRIAVPQASSGSFFMQVVPAGGSKDAKDKITWLLRVNLTQ